MSEMSMGPLNGVKVVELAALAPASVAGMLLSSLGAEVIRIDRLHHEADDEWNSLRRGRRSVSLDLKVASGMQLARELAAGADILIEAYRPGVMERLGLGPDVLQEENPRLIYGRLTGWGQNGPSALMAGHDISYLALTGALHPIGPADAPPIPPLNYVADIGGGTMFLIMGLLSALHERSSSGRGQVVDAAMVDGTPTLSATILRDRSTGRWVDERSANTLDGGAPFYRCYTCKDGRYIAVGAIEGPFYKEFVQGLGLASNSLPDQWDRSTWKHVSDQIAARVSTRTRKEWESIYEGTDACVAPVLTFEEAAQHPHLKSRSAFSEVDGHLQPGPAPKLDRTRLQNLSSAPKRGADTIAILNELGYSPSKVQKLLAEGTVYATARKEDDSTAN